MIEDFYTDLTLKQATTTVTDFIEEETYTETIIKGVINQAGSSEVEWGRARNINVDYKAYVEVNDTTLAIDKNDLINGYRVVSKPKNTISRNHHLKILLEEVV